MRPDFIQIPDIVASDRTIGYTAKFLYGYIYWLAKMKAEKCTASNAYLAELVGCSPQMIQKCLNELEKAGYVSRIYIDQAKKMRSEIIPRITYSRDVSLESDMVSLQSDTRVSLESDQNYINNKLDKLTISPTSIPVTKAHTEWLGKWEQLFTYPITDYKYKNLKAIDSLLQRHGTGKLEEAMKIVLHAKSNRYAPKEVKGCTSFEHVMWKWDKIQDYKTSVVLEHTQKKGLKSV